MMKRFGVDLSKSPINRGFKNMVVSPKSEIESMYTKNSNDVIDDDSSISYDINHDLHHDVHPDLHHDLHHNHNSVYDIYSSSTTSGLQLCNNNGSHIKCSICNLSSDNTNVIMLSCCNDICHVKCVIDKYNLFNYNSEMEYTEFNENLIDNEFFNKFKCLKCNQNFSYEDIFNLHSKFISYNKKYINEYDLKMTKLKDQKKKIENEIKCVNEYILKLQSEKNISQTIMSKTFNLMTL